MSSRTHARPGATYLAGFALGTGACAVALVGIPLSFWLVTTNHWLVFGITFAVGALLGAFLGRVPRLTTRPHERGQHDVVHDEIS